MFKILKDRHTSQNHTANEKQFDSYNNMKYDFTEDALLKEMIQKVIHLSNITIEIIGNWLWIGGNTYQYRKDLKEMGFKFAGKKKCWYWHSDAFRKRSHKVLSMDDIRSYYGSTSIELEHGKRFEA